MSGDIPHLGFLQAVELLAEVLPARALQSVALELTDEARERLALAGVDDLSIVALLDSQGIHCFQIIRNATRDVGVSEDTPGDVYAQVESFFHDDNNPMITHVRTLVRNLLTSQE